MSRVAVPPSPNHRRRALDADLADSVERPVEIRRDGRRVGHGTMIVRSTAGSPFAYRPLLRVAAVAEPEADSEILRICRLRPSAARECDVVLELVSPDGDDLGRFTALPALLADDDRTMLLVGRDGG